MISFSLRVSIRLNNFSLLFITDLPFWGEHYKENILYSDKFFNDLNVENLTNL